MMVERRFFGFLRTGEAAHAFETHVRGAALGAGLSVGPCTVDDLGLAGHRVRFSLSGEPEALDGFAAELHDGIRLEAAG